MIHRWSIVFFYNSHPGERNEQNDVVDGMSRSLTGLTQAHLVPLGDISRELVLELDRRKRQALMMLKLPLQTALASTVSTLQVDHTPVLNI
ncbi:hypothetical protein BDV59DRAFT_186555 [Aspergillus ambiguus]|uniref:uncharacterized protein n=1 Tax=Aspergillus ambiguus TaxID=176160 RepID=UPI003CCDC7FF